MQRNASGRGALGRKTANPVLNAALVAAIVLLAVGAFAATRALAGGASAQGGAVAVVRDADGGEHRLALSEDAELVVESSAGTNVVEVKDGRVRVRDADCPNQDCVEQGWIGDASQQIVCLPHKLTVDIEGTGSASGIDVMGR